jgi:transposase
MIIRGVDWHPSSQQIVFLDQETGECGERELDHSDGEAEKFYRELQQRRVSVRVGMEAKCNRSPVRRLDPQFC